MRFIQLGTPGRDEFLLNPEAIVLIEPNWAANQEVQKNFPWMILLNTGLQMKITEESMRKIYDAIEAESDVSLAQAARERAMLSEAQASAALAEEGQQSKPAAPAPPQNPQPAADGIEKHWGPRVIG